MTLTVGKGEGAKVVQRRTSLKDRVAIERINKYRKSQGKKNLKGTKEESAVLSPEDKALIESKGYKDVSPEVLARIKESEAAKKELGNKYVVRQGDKLYGVKEDTTPSRSVAMRTSGVSQIQGLNTNTGQVVNPNDLQSREEVVSSEEPSLVPIATENTGMVLFSDKSGNVYREVGSSEYGYIVSREEKKYKDSQLVLPDSKSIPIPPYGFFELSDKARRNIIVTGEQLQENAEGKGLLGVERSPFGSYLRSAVGGNLVRFGKHPVGYLGKEIVIPAGVGAASGIVVAGGTSLIGSSAVRGVVNVGAGVVGTGFAVAEVASRSASEQSPDILAGFVGGFRGVKNYDNVIGYVESPPKGRLFAGSEELASVSKAVFGSKEGKVFIGGRGANKPSKTFIRKQSTGQNYNPTYVQRGDEYLKVKTVNRALGTKETRIYTQVKGKQGAVVQVKASMATMIEKGGVDLKVSRYQKPPTKYESTYFKTPEGKYNNLVVTKGGEKLYEQVNFDESKSFKSINYKDYKRPRVENNFFIDKYYDTGLQKTVSKEAVIQKQINPGNFPIPKTEKYRALNIPFKDYPVDSNQISQYELSPNEVVKSSQYAFNPVRSPVRGGFRVRRSGARVVNVRPVFPSKEQGVFVSDNLPVPFYNKPVVPVVEASGVSVVSSGEGVISFRGSSVTGLSVSDVGGVSSVSPRDSLVSPVSDLGSKSVSIVAPVVLVDSRSDVVSDSLVSPVSVVKSGSVSVSSVRSKQNNIVDSVQASDVAVDSAIVSKSVFKEDVVSKKVVPVIPVVPVVPSPSPSGSVIDSVVPIDKFVFNRAVPPPSDIFGGRSRGGGFANSGFDSSSKAGSGLFRVIVGRKGNKIYSDLGVGGSDLVKKGFDIVKNSAAATVKVVPVDRGSTFSNVYSFSNSDFSSKEKGVFVQKVSKRISSRGEKEDIPYASKKRRITKGETFNKALVLNKSGFSLRSIRRKLL